VLDSRDVLTDAQLAEISTDITSHEGAVDRISQLAQDIASNTTVATDSTRVVFDAVADMERAMDDARKALSARQQVCTSLYHSRQCGFNVCFMTHIPLQSKIVKTIYQCKHAERLKVAYSS